MLIKQTLQFIGWHVLPLLYHANGLGNKILLCTGSCSTMLHWSGGAGGGGWTFFKIQRIQQRMFIQGGNKSYKIEGLTKHIILIAAGLAQSVERLTAEGKVTGSIPGVGPILRVLK